MFLPTVNDILQPLGAGGHYYDVLFVPLGQVAFGLGLLLLLAALSAGCLLSLFLGLLVVQDNHNVVWGGLSAVFLLPDGYMVPGSQQFSYGRHGTPPN